MKTILKSLFTNVVILYLLISFYPGVTFDRTVKTLLFTAFVLTLLNYFVKPIIKILLLPINILTLNLFSWVANVITLFLSTILVSGFDVTSFFFQGFTFQGFVIPSMQISLFISLVIASFFMSLFSAVLNWIYS